MQTESFLKMFKQILGIGFLWFMGMLLPITSFLFTNKKLNYHDDTVFYICYYLLFISLIFIFFPHTTRRVFINNHLKSYVLIPFVLALAAFCYGVFFNYLDPEREVLRYFKITENGNFVTGGLNYFFVKMFEITFQQTLITGLILSLASYFKKIRYVSLWYAVIFGLSHIFLLLILPISLTLMFLFFAMISAVVFPLLILNTQSGFIYTFVIHFAFYLLLGFVLIVLAVPNATYF